MNWRAVQAGDRGCTWSLQWKGDTVCSGTEAAGHFMAHSWHKITSQCPDEGTYVFSTHIAFSAVMIYVLTGEIWVLTLTVGDIE